MNKKPLLIKLAKIIAPKDAQNWLDDMNSELSFVTNNKLAWQIGALNFAIKQRFTNINLRSPQNLAFTSFALAAVLALIFVLPYKNTLLPQNPNQSSSPMLEAMPAPAPQAAVAPSRAEVSSELRSRTNEITANDEKYAQTDSQRSNAPANSPVISVPSPEAIITASNPNLKTDSASVADLATIVEKPVEELEDIVNLADSPATVAKVSPPANEEVAQAEVEINTSSASNPDALEAEQQNLVTETTASGAADVGTVTAAGQSTAASIVGTAGPAGSAASANPEQSIPQNPNDIKLESKIKEIIIVENSISISFLADTKIKIYSGTSPKAENLLLDKIAKKNEELAFALPLYLELDYAANVLINNEPISDLPAEFVAIFKSAKSDN